MLQQALPGVVAFREGLPIQLLVNLVVAGPTELQHPSEQRLPVVPSANAATPVLHPRNEVVTGQRQPAAAA